MKAKVSRAFTLIELLVVIAIIAILAAILFPVFAQARNKARQISDLSNLKQLGLGVLMYVQDSDETMPHSGTFEPNGMYYPWEVQVSPYIKSPQVFISPQYSFKWDSTTFPGGASGNDWALMLKAGVVTLNNGVYTFPVSYGANGMNDYFWNVSPCGNAFTAWTDGSGGPGHYGPFGTENITDASLAVPSDTVLLEDSKYPDMWNATSFDLPLVSGGCNGFNVAAGFFVWTTTDPMAIGPFNGQENVVFADGHAKSHRFFTACPHTFTVQDDQSQDPVQACRTADYM